MLAFMDLDPVPHLRCSCNFFSRGTQCPLCLASLHPFISVHSSSAFTTPLTPTKKHLRYNKSAPTGTRLDVVFPVLPYFFNFPSGPLIGLNRLCLLVEPLDADDLQRPHRLETVFWIRIGASRLEIQGFRVFGAFGGVRLDGPLAETFPLFAMSTSGLSATPTPR